MMARFDPVYKPTTTIADGAALSSPVDFSLLSARGLALEISAGWVTADIAFQVSDLATEPVDDDDSWRTVYKPTTDESASEPLKLKGVLSSAALYLVSAEAWVLGSYRWVRLISRDETVFATEIAQTGGPLEIKMVTLA